MSICLTTKEICDLTRRKMRKAQMEQLTYMGIHFMTTTTGEIVVLRSALEQGRKADDGFRPPKAMDSSQ